MKKSLTLVAVSALALAAAACGRTENNASAVSAEDNMLVPADENASAADMPADANAAGDMSAMGGNDAMAGDNAAAGNAM